MCRQCNIVETNSRIVEMSVEQVRAVATNIRKIGGGIVLLTGGEPFLRRDLPEIVEAFVSNGLNVRLQTAGTKVATAETIQACYDAGARDINVSLDSLEPNTSDYINGVPGSGESAIRSIELISSIFRKRSSILSFGTVLSRINYREIPAIVRFAERIGWYVSLVPVHIASKQDRFGFRSYDKLFQFSPSHADRLSILEQELLSVKKRTRTLFDSKRYLTSAVQFLLGNSPKWRDLNNGKCDSPNLYFAIRPNGDFTTCCDYTLENPPKVYTDEFVEAYRSGQIARRDDVRAIVERCPGCHYGSYPEVSLSVRDADATLERMKLVFTSGRGRLSRSVTRGGFLAEIARVRAEFPDIYPVSQWQDPDVLARLTSWSDPEARKQILAEDAALRIIQGRERGKGQDVPIRAYSAL